MENLELDNEECTRKTHASRKHKNRVKIFRKQLFQKIGKDCFLCHSNNHLVCHRIDWKPHQRLANMASFVTLKKENPKDYVRLCFRCHFGVHWVHNLLGLSWKQIVNLSIKCGGANGRTKT